jgi:hypothetical protein
MVSSFGFHVTIWDVMTSFGAGTIVFACHKVTAPLRTSPTATTNMQQMGYNANNFVSQQQNQPYYDPSGNAYPNTPQYSSSGPAYNHSYPSQPPYPPQHWPEGTDPLASLAPLPNNMRSSSYPPQQQWPNQPYMDPSQAYPPRTSTPDYVYNGGAGNESGSSSAANDVVPPPKRRVSPGIPGTTRETHGGRSSGNRPTGIQKCTSCKTTQSPEWRKGPSGKKELCNASAIPCVTLAMVLIDYSLLVAAACVMPAHVQRKKALP